MPMVVLIPCLAAALLLVTACEGFHAGYVSAGGAPAATARGIDTSLCRARRLPGAQCHRTGAGRRLGPCARPGAGARLRGSDRPADHRLEPRRCCGCQRHPRRQRISRAGCRAQDARRELRGTRVSKAASDDRDRQDLAARRALRRTDWDGSDTSFRAGAVPPRCRPAPLWRARPARRRRRVDRHAGRGLVGRLRRPAEGRTARPCRWPRRSRALVRRGFQHRGRPARRRRAASRARRPPRLAGPCLGRRDGTPAQRAFGQG